MNSTTIHSFNHPDFSITSQKDSNNILKNEIFLKKDNEYCTISGKITDATSQKPISHAPIQITGSKKIIRTNQKGEFSALLPCSGNTSTPIKLSISCFGHQPFQANITSCIDTVFSIELQPIIFDEVHVEAQNQASNNISARPEIITSDNLISQPAQTFGETLEKIPGISLLQTGASIAKPVVRGLTGQRVNIINAGVQQEGQQWGAEHAPEIDPFSIDKIEVYKGTSALEYSSGAIGGVIITKPKALPISHVGSTLGMNGSLQLSGFSNNSQGAGNISLEGSHLIEGLGWRAQFGSRYAGNTRTPKYVMQNTGFRELNSSFAIGITRDDWSMKAMYSYFSTTLGIFKDSHIGNLTDLMRAIERGNPIEAGSFSYEINNPKQDITHDLWSVQAHKHLSEKNILEIQYGWQQNNRSEFDAHNSRFLDSTQLSLVLGKPSMKLSLTTYSLDVKIKNENDTIAGLPCTNVVGISGSRQGNVRSGAVLLIPNFRAYSLGLYGISNLTLSEVCTISAGIRYDAKWNQIYAIESQRVSIPDTSLNFAGFSGVLSAKFILSLQESIYANFGSTWRQPLVNELFSNDVHHGTAQYEIGSRQLQPERNLSFDASYNYQSSVFSLNIGMFANAIANYMYLRPDAENPTITIRGTFPTFRYNQNTALIYGIEFSGERNFSTSVLFGASCSILRGINLDDNSPLFQIPSDRFRVYSQVKIDQIVQSILSSNFTNTFIELGLLGVRRQTEIASFTDYAAPPAGYFLADFKLSSHIPTSEKEYMTCSISLKNLFNTRYRDYLSRYRYFSDDPGISVNVQCSIPFSI